MRGPTVAGPRPTKSGTRNSAIPSERTSKLGNSGSRLTGAISTLTLEPCRVKLSKLGVLRRSLASHSAYAALESLGIGTPSTARILSPRRTPALLAGLPSCTLRT